MPNIYKLTKKLKKKQKIKKRKKIQKILKNVFLTGVGLIHLVISEHHSSIYFGSFIKS